MEVLKDCVTPIDALENGLKIRGAMAARIAELEAALRDLVAVLASDGDGLPPPELKARIIKLLPADR